MSDYAYFDRHTDGLASLHEFCKCASLVDQCPSNWKYSIISIHNALQAYLCLCLSGGNGFQTWNKKGIGKWLDAYRERSPLPSIKLDVFMELYDRGFHESSSEARANIAWLNNTRNKLIHFNQDSFSIHIQSAYLCCKEAVLAIQSTPNSAIDIFFYEEEERQRFDAKVVEALRILSTIEKSM